MSKNTAPKRYTVSYQHIIARLTVRIWHAPDRYEYGIKEGEWMNYGKHRVYLSITEKAIKGSNHYATYDFGYYDVDNGTYTPGRHDAMGIYDLSGAHLELTDEEQKVFEQIEREDSEPFSALIFDDLTDEIRQSKLYKAYIDADANWINVCADEYKIQVCEQHRKIRAVSENDAINKVEVMLKTEAFPKGDIKIYDKNGKLVRWNTFIDHEYDDSAKILHGHGCIEKNGGYYTGWWDKWMEKTAKEVASWES